LPATLTTARRPVTAAEVRAELLRWSDPVTAAVAPAHKRRRRPFARLGVATMAALTVPGALLVAWPDQKPARPPAVFVSPISNATAPAAASPSASLANVAPSKMATAPTPQPEPSPSPLPRSAPDQITDLKTLVRQQQATGQLAAKNADELDHMLKDLSSLVVQGKQREAHDKLAAIQKKNNDLLAAEKIPPAGHAALEDGLDQLATAIANMPKA
jgi:hypothetical protein